jgi:phospholipid transport system substrate-binding protein
MHIALVSIMYFMATMALASEPLPVTNPDSGQQRIESFHIALLAAMAMPEHETREAHLTPIIADTFDLPRIASISLGRTWRDLDQAQRAAFIELLSQLISATYADRFDSFNGQRFSTTGVEQARGGEVVRTELTKSDGDKVSLDYFLRDGRIFNVVADGVSDLSLRRADYSSIIKSEGYAALLERIKEKVELARAGS